MKYEIERVITKELQEALPREVLHQTVFREFALLLSQLARRAKGVGDLTIHLTIEIEE